MHAQVDVHVYAPALCACDPCVIHVYGHMHVHVHAHVYVHVHGHMHLYVQGHRKSIGMVSCMCVCAGACVCMCMCMCVWTGLFAMQARRGGRDGRLRRLQPLGTRAACSCRYGRAACSHPGPRVPECTYHQLLTTHYSLLAAHYSLLTKYYLLSTTH